MKKYKLQNINYKNPNGFINLKKSVILSRINLTKIIVLYSERERAKLYNGIRTTNL